MLTGNAWGAGATGAGAGQRAPPGTGWHPPGTAVVSSCQHDPGVSCTARAGGTWRPLQQKLKISSGTTIFSLTIFKRHLEKEKSGSGYGRTGRAGGCGTPVAVPRRGRSGVRGGCRRAAVCLRGGLSRFVPAPTSLPMPPGPAPIRGAAGAETEKGRPRGSHLPFLGGQGQRSRAAMERVAAILGCWTEPRARCRGRSLGR